MCERGVLSATCVSEAFCPNIQPRAHARLTGLTNALLEEQARCGAREAMTVGCKPTILNHTPELYPTCCPLVRDGPCAHGKPELSILTRFFEYLSFARGQEAGATRAKLTDR